MNKKTIDIIAKKLSDIAGFLKSREVDIANQTQIREILAQFIDKNLIDDNDLAYLLVENEKNVNKRNLPINVEANRHTDLNINDIHKILYFLKTDLAMLIDIYPGVFNFYIYLEIRDILSYYVSETKKTSLYDDVSIMFTTKQKGYHQQVMMFKYLFSLFDKFLNINLFLESKFDLKKVEEPLANYRFPNDFVAVSKSLFRDSVAERKMTDLMQRLWKSSIYHYIRVLRNNIEHNFTNIENKFNLSFAIESLFILIMRIVLEIISDFKCDEDIYNLLVKK